MSTPISTEGTRDDDHDVLQQFFASGGSIRMLIDVDQRDMDTVGAYADQLFAAGDWAAARNFYFMLARIDHWNFEYWFSLGICYQRLGQHEEAIFCLSRAGMIRVDDPRSSYHAGISYRVTGNLDYACKAFNAARNWCGEQPDYRAFKSNIEQHLAQCKQEGEVG
ncbi:SycD/LcrH family type III secretion system chaperone [Burkholderia ubonensis]|uniref:SycD/LcrH family type III secretion system chaperone n=1 Tax=Burkholderia ubonensis TaxID=101571 RepID=UPI000758125A|nr:SycD/LcrH family type III secretion system chaperone [Burkholderia ubonensis]KVX77022.1 type III secretion protein [Burkholderia ubonensis]